MLWDLDRERCLLCINDHVPIELSRFGETMNETDYETVNDFAYLKQIIKTNPSVVSDIIRFIKLNTTASRKQGNVLRGF